MGFWDWISGLFSGQSPADWNAPAARRPPTSARGGESAVALLDPIDQRDQPVVEATEVEKWWAPEGVTQTDPVPLPRPEMSIEARGLENILVSHLDGHNLNLPPLPRVAERVLRHLGHDDYGVAQVAKDISEDAVTVAAVLRLANSPLYRGIEKVTAIQPAVARLGAVAIRTVMMQQVLRVAALSIKGHNRALAEILWKRSLVSAHVMRGLSRFSTLDENEAYLIGLLHDIGQIIVLREMDKQAAVLKCRIDLPTFEYICQECHQEFGELIADEWQLPETLKALVSNHHTPPQPEDPLRTQRLQLQLADMICEMLGYGPMASYQLLDSHPVRGLGLDNRDDFVDWLSALPDDIEQNVDFE